jgi:hypothetical protein
MIPRPRTAPALALALAALGLAAPGLAQTPATVGVDDVRVRGGGRHRATVSVLDATGIPCAGLEQGFRVTVDGRPVEDLRARPGREAHASSRVTLVVDANLLSGETLRDVREALAQLARGLRPGDEVRVVAAGSRARERGGPARSAERLAEGLGDLHDEGTPRLYDALYAAVRATARRSERQAGVVVLVTRGVDGESRRGPLDVLAMARGPARLTPVLVALLGDAGEPVESDRLQRLAAHAGGTLAGVTSTAGLGNALEALTRRGLDTWVLTFRDRGWERSQPRHSLSLVVEQGGARRSADREVVTEEALVPAWWRSPTLGPGLVLLLALGVAGFLLTRRRQRGLLVHDGDDEDGTWYEIFAFPVTLGGAEGNDIVLGDAQVSRNHAVLERRGRTVELVDLNSENGTRVNGERIARRVLADGDRVSLGPAVHLLYEARG